MGHPYNEAIRRELDLHSAPGVLLFESGEGDHVHGPAMVQTTQLFLAEKAVRRELDQMDVEERHPEADIFGPVPHHKRHRPHRRPPPPFLPPRTFDMIDAIFISAKANQPPKGNSMIGNLGKGVKVVLETPFMIEDLQSALTSEYANKPVTVLYVFQEGEFGRKPVVISWLKDQDEDKLVGRFGHFLSRRIQVPSCDL